MKHIKIDKAKRLEDSIAIWSDPKPLNDDEWELQNEDGSKHERSDEFVNAVNSIYESKKIIKEILK